MTGDAPLLVVDDDPEICSALARGLGLHGYAVETRNRADTALPELTGQRYVAAVVDVMLGADSGIELVRAARAGGAQLPIVMLSALSEVEHRTAGLEAGADDYVIKPFSFDELVARLKVQERRVAALRPSPARLRAQDQSLATETRSEHLTEREFALLALLADHAGTPCPVVPSSMRSGPGSRARKTSSTSISATCGKSSDLPRISASRSPPCAIAASVSRVSPPPGDPAAVWSCARAPLWRKQP